MSKGETHQTRYPLRAVIRRTGLSADVIRAWERRYGAVMPQRSAGGQRLYTHEDVTRLALLRRATADGHSIGEIARLDVSALERLLAAPHPQRGDGSQHAGDETIRAAMAATDRLDPLALEHALKRAVFSLGVERFVDQVVSGFLRAVGDRWHDGTLSPAHEHLASSTTRHVLGWVMDAYEPAGDAARVLIATPAGELHELGAMAAAAAAAAEGALVVYLGPNLPATDIASAAKLVRADAVALSAVYANGDATSREVLETASLVPEGVSVVIGGPAADRLEMHTRASGVRVLHDLDAFRRLLRSFRARRTENGQARSD